MRCHEKALTVGDTLSSYHTQTNPHSHRPAQLRGKVLAKLVFPYERGFELPTSLKGGECTATHVNQAGFCNLIYCHNVSDLGCVLTNIHIFRGSQEQQASPHPQEIPTESWYPSSVVSSPSSSRPTTPSPSSSGSFSVSRPSDRQNSASHVSPAEAAGIIAVLKDKSVEELRKLYSDKDAYHNFLLSLEAVKTQNNVRDELRNETMQLARENLEKEPRIMELRNQCRIIRTTELAAAQEKLHELERRKGELLKFYSPASLLRRLHEATNKTDEESDTLHRQLLDQEIDISAFVQKYKKLRQTYHKQALTHLAAKTSITG